MRRLLGFALMAILVAACSSSPAVPPTVGAGSSHAAGGNTSDSCSLLSQAEIQTATGFAVGAGSHQDGNLNQPCHWDGPVVSGSQEYVELQLDPSGSLYNFDTGSPVPNLGQSAKVNSVGQVDVRLANGNGFTVFILASDSGSGQVVAETRLAQLVVPRMGG